jgi:DNA polymerase-3 subunit beta
MVKITATAGAWASALSKLRPLVKARQTVPILSCVLIAPGKGGVAITGDDLDTRITVPLDAEHDMRRKAVGICVPLARVLAFARAIPVADRMTLAESNGIQTLSGGGASIRDRVMARYLSDDFPAGGDLVDALVECEWGEGVCDGLRRALPFASHEETRYYLNGCALQFRESWSLVATDGHRLINIPIGDHVGKAKPREAFDSAILPRALVETIVRLWPDEGPVRVRLFASRIALEMGGTLVVGRLIDGTYPDWRRVVDGATGEGLEKILALPSADLYRATRHACDLIRVMSGSGYWGSCCLYATDSTVHLESRPDGGQVVVPVGLALDVGTSPVRPHFNPIYLRDLLKSMPGGELTIGIKGEHSALVFQTAGSDALALLMPMRGAFAPGQPVRGLDAEPEAQKPAKAA